MIEILLASAQQSLPALATALGLSLLLGFLLGMAKAHLPRESEELVTQIEGLLPQIQCAQCGYPGCRPYAAAIAKGEPINLCPPGGSETIADLARLLDREPLPLDASLPAFATTQLARIDESLCIGCTLCLAPCPVDAISGARGFIHTVITEHCTGCGLCLAPCPVSCIEMVEVS